MRMTSELIADGTFFAYADEAGERKKRVLLYNYKKGSKVGELDTNAIPEEEEAEEEEEEEEVDQEDNLGTKKHGHGNKNSPLYIDAYSLQLSLKRIARLRFREIDFPLITAVTYSHRERDERSKKQAKSVTFRGHESNYAELDLSVNDLECLEELERFTNCEYFNVSFNQLGNLEGMRTMKRLTTLNVSHNNLTTLDGIETLRQLKHLDASMNNLIDISFLEDFDQLDTLILTGNRIKALERLEGVGKSLQTLKINKNHLPEVNHLVFLNRIKHLDVSDNNIADLSLFSDVIGLLEDLKEVQCYDNPMCTSQYYLITVVEAASPGLAIIDNKAVGCYDIHQLKVERKHKQFDELKDVAKEKFEREVARKRKIEEFELNVLRKREKRVEDTFALYETKMKEEMGVCIEYLTLLEELGIDHDLDVGTLKVTLQKTEQERIKTLLQSLQEAEEKKRAEEERREKSKTVAESLRELSKSKPSEWRRKKEEEMRRRREEEHAVRLARERQAEEERLRRERELQMQRQRHLDKDVADLSLSELYTAFQYADDYDEDIARQLKERIAKETINVVQAQAYARRWLAQRTLQRLRDEKQRAAEEEERKRREEEEKKRRQQKKKPWYKRLFSFGS
eukprot:Nk52_evm28s226 gene=Nk52_evmTU28s226